MNKLKTLFTLTTLALALLLLLNVLLTQTIFKRVGKRKTFLA